MQKKFASFLLIVLVLAGLLFGCVRVPATESLTEPVVTETSLPAYWPDAEWRTSTPEEQGIDSAAILSMLQEIEQKGLGIHSLLIIRHGYLVTEIYFLPYAKETKHPVFSVTKSVTSAMTGLAIQEGYIKNVQQNVLDFFPEVQKETDDKYLQKLTIEHLLTMSAGFNTDTLPNPASQDAQTDTVKHVLTYNSFLDEPGKTFYYDSGLPHVMSAIIQKTTGLTLESYTRKKLFAPLGITDYCWQSDPQGVTTGNSGLCLHSQAMAKLGYLYLHNGQWAGKQILPSEWIRVSTAKHIETKGLMNSAEDNGYGYFWWIDSFDGYSAHGYGGQFIYVLPKLDMVIVFTGGLSDSKFPEPRRLIETHLIPAAQSIQPLPKNSQAFNQLVEEIKAIENPEKPVEPLPDIARQISGKPFVIVNGDRYIRWPVQFKLTFSSGDTYTSELIGLSSQTLTTIGGLNNIFYMNKYQENGVEDVSPVRGRWVDDKTFVEERSFSLYSGIGIDTITYTFEGKKLFVVVSPSMESFPPAHATGEMVE